MQYKIAGDGDQQLEGELEQVSNEHTNLKKASEKQHSLEKDLRSQLTSQLNSLKEQNKQLKGMLSLPRCVWIHLNCHVS